jgi:predicted RNase H-like nuclease
MTRVLGVDGAKGGWVAALVEGDHVRWLRLAHIREALTHDVMAIGVDMPIGLPQRGRRECDLLAKRALGRAHPRVFLAPPRDVLDATSYVDAGARHRAHTGGLGLSVQTWHIVERIREVDAVADDPRLVEVHPELSFARLAGEVLVSKHSAAGRVARLQTLRRRWPRLDRLPAGDDALDALAAAWSAERWVQGTAESMPVQAPVDERERPMRIVV